MKTVFPVIAFQGRLTHIILSESGIHKYYYHPDVGYVYDFVGTS